MRFLIALVICMSIAMAWAPKAQDRCVKIKTECHSMAYQTCLKDLYPSGAKTRDEYREIQDCQYQRGNECSEAKGCD